MEAVLDKITKQNTRLEKRFSGKLEVNPDLNRTLVSFQANKKTPFYRWYKFKEGYSSELVFYVFDKLNLKKGELIDPFAGSGTSLFASSERKLDSLGIELLPFAVEIIAVKRSVLNGNRANIAKKIKDWVLTQPWKEQNSTAELSYFNITRGAYPEDTATSISNYLTAIEHENVDTKRVLRFALMSILEEISFTRKDGQYLRWDYRSGRRQGSKPFDKGRIKNFDEAILEKLNIIQNDLDPKEPTFDFFRPRQQELGNINILQGSCLSVLPKLESNRFDILMTSPPYCNRYDYTRTYALELALFLKSEEQLKSIRQEMMSCTVENKEKNNLDQFFSDKLISNASRAFYEQKELQTILDYLEDQKQKKELNNPGILRMVKNYFFEMSLIIFECARVLKRGAPFVMVNDNVRYEGAHIPVDLILSDIAEKAGFEVERIWVLPNGKGNSSQQMGKHGRQELRKCVYVWRRL